MVWAVLIGTHHKYLSQCHNTITLSGNVNCTMTNIRLAPGQGGHSSSGQTLLSALLSAALTLSTTADLTADTAGWWPVIFVTVTAAPGLWRWPLYRMYCQIVRSRTGTGYCVGRTRSVTVSPNTFAAWDSQYYSFKPRISLNNLVFT